MKIALLSDVHANLPALRTALEVADDEGAERILVAGDVVGDGPFPREVIELLMRREVPAICGNVDRKVLDLGTKAGKLEKRLDKKNGQKRNRAWTALRLAESEEARGWLAELPAALEFELEGQPVLVVHGSPLGDTDYVYPSLTGEALEAKLAGWAGARPTLLVCGHSHVPFGARLNGVTVINCGSVGRPADGDPRGSLALVEIGGTGGIRAEIIRFRYPVDEMVEALEARGVPGIDPSEYRRGVKS